MMQRWLVLIACLVFAVIVALAGAITLTLVFTYPRLPSLETLTDYKPKIPLRIFTADEVQIGEFGEERRDFVPIEKVPLLMKQAILAAEDERFYSHGGVDYIGVARAALSNLASGHAQSGASTITMQVARNFFLSSEKTFSRKFNEALLSFKIEHSLSKDKILELYINQIYLGQRAYGFSAAAQAYYGKTLPNLTIAEMAMLAGLPKAPSSYNPVVNPSRAKLRQQYVLRRMRELQMIDVPQYNAAKVEPLNVVKKSEGFSIQAEYVAEMARQFAVEKYQDAAYTQGIQVYTTLLSTHQTAAYQAARNGVLAYDRRHGYRGPEGFIELSDLDNPQRDGLDEKLSEFTLIPGLLPAVVTRVTNNGIDVYLPSRGTLNIATKGLQFASRALSNKLAPTQRIRVGAVVRLQQVKEEWQVVQLPEVEVGVVAMDPNNGAIRALVGGFDFNRNKFNHVTQAWRQPGSTFKPFIYSAGIERGFTPATQINDAPLIIDPASIGGQRWEPKNFDGKFLGMMTLRDALTKSKNLVSIRILQSITPDYAQAYIGKFGFEAKNHPAYLTMALGAGMVTPLQMAEAYSVFANTGYRVPSYFIDHVSDAKGQVLARTQPVHAGENAERTLDARNAFIMTSIMKDVTRFGTAAKASVLNRNDLAGKTGTTNDTHDAWFAGYTADLVAVSWIGFDQPRSLGGTETGGQAALPIWIEYIGQVLQGVPERAIPMPDGVITIPTETSRGVRDEYFYAEFPQTNPELGLDNAGTGSTDPIEDEVRDMLF
ncbi:penicillin-binding protein 1A [Chitinimonas sp. BJB300]|uniref:penicillin-binding protein 1A n=1 Tax=Chitinimonas sp. BJB300 TaxID=1559339 RepID=UPI000C0DF34E|nr:penicillin-binding protein 1A [Chitinimonas sp. BJB300]PHV11982.1 penicillin-binding protein [Chitinimonas sp. BJB300]TSJ91425.1 penicillin-binding protein 1A [Chitinimonas sp. BJB300]